MEITIRRRPTDPNASGQQEDAWDFIRGGVNRLRGRLRTDGAEP